MRPQLLIALMLLTSLACNLDLSSPAEEPAATEVPLQPSATAPPAITEPIPASKTPDPSSTPPPAAPTLPNVQALPDPAGYAWREVSAGYQQPLGLVHTADGRQFVVEQRGMIWVLQDMQRLEQPFLDLRDRVNSGAFEQGLLGLAFHPEFPSNGRFFVNYTRAGGDTVIAGFTAPGGGNQGDPGSEQVLLVIDQPFANHNGGGVAFGPDGYLYIGAGDGGSANDPFGNGQSLDTLLGKLLRIDMDSGEPYGIPPDNPFVGGGGRPEIWAYGLRNPWRFSFDSQIGDLYIGDVGQNAWEEIDFLPAGAPGGANFGWNHREGRHPFGSQQTEGLIDPVAEYRNGIAFGGSETTCSVTGGAVVRDPELPEWTGVYVYGDYCSGDVWGLVRDAAGQWQNQLLFQTGLRISSFGTGADRSLYLVHHGGAIYRLEATP